MRSWLKLIGMALTLLAYASSAEAQLLYKAGKILNVFVSAPNNYAVRVALATDMTGCANGFFYFNGSTANYDTYVATMLTAYALGKTANLTVVPDAGGTCVIQEFYIN